MLSCIYKSACETVRAENVSDWDKKKKKVSQHNDRTHDVKDVQHMQTHTDTQIVLVTIILNLYEKKRFKMTSLAIYTDALTMKRASLYPQPCYKDVQHDRQDPWNGQRWWSFSFLMHCRPSGRGPQMILIHVSGAEGQSQSERKCPFWLCGD